MSYINRNNGQTKGTAWIAVAAVHGVALYALINGLGIEYIKETIANLPARNYEEPVPPPPTMPEPVPQKPTKSTVDVVKPMVPTATQPTTFTVTPRPLDDFKLTPLPIPEPFTPKPIPQFKPVAASPKGSPGGWVTTNDYPTRDIRQGNEGTAVFLLAIDTNGRVTNCQITRSSGHPGLDEATCGKVSQRARFTPARDESGQSVTGTYTGRITWVIPE